MNREHSGTCAGKSFRQRMWQPDLARFSPTAVALAFTAIFATAIIGVFPPFWNGNDDLAMSMIAEGYGLAAYPSPAFAVSNVLYGYAIGCLPQIGDLSRYSCVAMALNIVAIFFVCRALCLLHPHALLALAATAVVALLPLAFPRFTVLAGMLTVAGVLQVLVHLREGRVSELMIAAGLLFVGYLVRSQSFYLVLLASLCLLPWKQLFVRRVAKLTFAGLAVAIAAAALADWAYYQRPEWNTFLEFGLPRMGAITDYGLASYILAHPALLQGTSYTMNDVALLGNWWFVDPSISDPASLSNLLARVSVVALVGGNLTHLWTALLTLIEPPLLTVFIPSMAMLALAQNRLRLAAAGAMLLVVVLGLGLSGRPSTVTYVLYAPLVLILCVGAIGIKPSAAQVAGAVLMLVCAVAATASIAQQHAHQRQEYAKAKRDLAEIDKSQLYVLWGTKMPLQLMYPVFGSMAAVRDFRWYGIGWGSIAPFATAHWKGVPGGLPDRLAAGAAIPFIATAEQINLLSIYCEERRGRRMRIVDIRELSIGTIFTVLCR